MLDHSPVAAPKRNQTLPSSHGQRQDFVQVPSQHGTPYLLGIKHVCVFIRTDNEYEHWHPFLQWTQGWTNTSDYSPIDDPPISKTRHCAALPTSGLLHLRQWVPGQYIQYCIYVSAIPVNTPRPGRADLSLSLHNLHLKCMNEHASPA